jgi:serine/threonine-protein kinase
VPSKVNPALPPGFDAWFARACAADPAERFPTGLAFARELQSACGLGRASLVAHDSTPVPVVDPPTSRPQRDDSPRLPRVSLAPAGRRRRAGAQGTVKPPAMQAAAPSTPGRRLTEPAAMRLAFVLALCGFALLLGVRLH